MPEPKEIQDVVQSQSRLLDKLDSEYRRKTEKLFSDFYSRLGRILRDPAAFSVPEQIQIIDALTVQDQLVPILQDAGLGEFINDYRNEFKDITVQAISFFNLFNNAQSLQPNEAEALSFMLEQFEDRITGKIDETFIQPVRVQLGQALVAGSTSDQVVSNIQQLETTLTPRQTTTLVTDSFNQFQRAVTTQKAESLGLEIYWYTGPLDKITSSQCQALLTLSPHGVPGMLYKDEISSSLHPALQGDPLIMGGHWNCRHKYMPVTESFALEQGFQPRG